MDIRHNSTKISIQYISCITISFWLQSTAEKYSIPSSPTEQKRYSNTSRQATASQCFCLLTAGGAPVEVIRSYIETQGEKIHEKVQR